jgi:hypothetical protein
MANLDGGVSGEDPEHHVIRVAHKLQTLMVAYPIWREPRASCYKSRSQIAKRVAHKLQTLMVAYLKRTQSIML